MPAPRIINTPQTTSVVLTAADLDLTLNDTIDIGLVTNAYAVDLSAGAGGRVTVGSVITARIGIQNTGSSVYAIDVLAAGQLSNIFLQNGVATITNAGLDHSRPYDQGKRRTIRSPTPIISDGS